MTGTPEIWLATVREGAALDDFRMRTVHEPVSPIRGAVGALLRQPAKP